MNLKKFSKGFTLIELLVVIGILAVLAAGLVALIDPVQKNREASDAIVQTNIGQIATALQAYAAQDTNGAYPATWVSSSANVLVTSGQLTTIPSLPNGGVYSYSTGAGNTYICAPLQSKKSIAKAAAITANATSAVSKWDSQTGKACIVATCATACP